jgi:hypothetical protein
MRVQHPYNGLDKFKDAINSQLAEFNISADWWQSEYCDRTFIVMIHQDNTDIELNLRFYPEFYAMTAQAPDNVREASFNRLVATMREKLDACIYY